MCVLDIFGVCVFLFVHFRAKKSGHTLILQFFGMQIFAKLISCFWGTWENFSNFFKALSDGKIDAGKVSLKFA